MLCGDKNHKTTRDIKMYIEIQISKTLRATVQPGQVLLEPLFLANKNPLLDLGLFIATNNGNRGN
jgi:hypothetical protein